MASWEGFSIQIPGQNLLKPVKSILQTLLIFLEIAKALLEVIKAFLLALGNPLIALLEALIALIEALFKSMQQTGLYAYFDVPEPWSDPNFKRVAGGFQAYKQRWKGSLLDARDSHRPQPTSFLSGGFFMFVVDAEEPLSLIQLVKSLLAFFKHPSHFVAPQYPPPVHVKATPLKPGSGDPILSVADMFQTQATDLALEWKLPGIVPTGDVGFSGITSQIVQNFRVPNWLIEVGLTPPAQTITISPDITGNFDTSAMTSGTNTGRLVQTITTPFTDPRHIGNYLMGMAPVLDDYYDPVIKMSYYFIVDGFSAFLAAQLGTVRYVVPNVPLDQNIYFRVRAFFGTLDTSPASGTNVSNAVMVNWRSPLVAQQKDGSGIFQLPWPSADTTVQMSMGKPSTMIHTKISTIPNIDVIGDITAIFQAAFSLNFHVSLPPATPTGQVDSRGNPVYAPQFDSAGNPILPLTTANIGQGSCTTLAGGVAGAIFPAPVTGFSAADFQPDPVTHEVPQQPWQNTSVIFQSKRLAIRFANILMEQGGSVLQSFKTLLRGPMPAGGVSITWSSGVPTYLEELVLYMTKVESVPPDLGPSVNASVAAVLAQALPTTTVTYTDALAYSQAFVDTNTRRNVLAAVNFLLDLNYQGVPPDWLSVSLLDLIPWSGQLIYDLIAKIQALVDAFQGIVQEIINFINMLERKINTLEQFIEYLISILNFLINLEVGFYLLAAPSVSGDVSNWLSLIDTAGGNVPSSGPSGYTAGICLAFLGPNVGAIASAFALLF